MNEMKAFIDKLLTNSGPIVAIEHWLFVAFIHSHPLLFSDNL